MVIKKRWNDSTWLWIQGMCGKKAFLMLLHPLINLEIQKYYQNEPKLNGIYSRDNLPDKIKDGTYVINLAECADTGTRWIALHVNDNIITYFDRSRVKHIPWKIKKFINGSTITSNIFRI